MLNFTKFTGADIDIVRPYLDKQSYRSCDYTVGGIYLWQEEFCPLWCIDGGMLYMRVDCPRRGRFYMPPVGEGSISSALLRIAEHCALVGESPVFSGVPREALPAFFESFGQGVHISEDRDSADYVYNAEDLRELAGKKYHGQRNHAAFFERNYADYRYARIEDGDIDNLLSFLSLQYAPSVDDAARSDLAATEKMIDEYQKYGLCGGCLKNGDGRIAAFAFGEIQGDTLYVHVEKADRAMRGAYQTIVRSFARDMGQSVRYINREDDAGDEGLRISKTSYHPAFLVDKYTVCI